MAKVIATSLYNHQFIFINIFKLDFLEPILQSMTTISIVVQGIQSYQLKAASLLRQDSKALYFAQSSLKRVGISYILRNHALRVEK